MKNIVSDACMGGKRCHVEIASHVQCFPSLVG